MTRSEAQEAWEKIVETVFSDYEKLTSDERVWFNVEPLTTDGIVNYYINYGAEHNDDTIDDLEYLEHRDVADLLRAFNKLFDNGRPPKDIDERNEQIVNWNEGKTKMLDESKSNTGH